MPPLPPFVKLDQVVGADQEYKMIVQVGRLQGAHSVGGIAGAVVALEVGDSDLRMVGKIFGRLKAGLVGGHARFWFQRILR